MSPRKCLPQNFSLACTLSCFLPPSLLLSFLSRCKYLAEEEKMYYTPTYIAAQKDGIDYQKKPIPVDNSVFLFIWNHDLDHSHRFLSFRFPTTRFPSTQFLFCIHLKATNYSHRSKALRLFFLYIAVQKFFPIKLSINPKMAVEECIGGQKIPSIIPSGVGQGTSGTSADVPNVGL